MHTKDTYKDSRLKPSVVYWIHYPEHQDPYKDGYIGITTKLEDRITAHKRNKRLVSKFLKGAVFEILFDCETLLEAASIEKQYRPEPNIGWNLNPGGDIPPSQKGRSYSAQKLKGSTRTKKQQEASKKHSERMKGRIPHNKGDCMKIIINDVEYSSAYEAAKTLGWSLSKVYRVGKRDV